MLTNHQHVYLCIDALQRAMNTYNNTTLYPQVSLFIQPDLDTWSLQSQNTQHTVRYKQTSSELFSSQHITSPCWLYVLEWNSDSKQTQSVVIWLITM